MKKQFEQDKSIDEFVSFWSDKGDEKQDTQKFWMHLLKNPPLHLPHPS